MSLQAAEDDEAFGPAVRSHREAVRTIAAMTERGHVPMEVTADGVRMRDDLVAPKVTPAPAPAKPAPPSLDALVNAAARSTSKRTQALGVKVSDLATVLRQRLTDEREAAEVAERQNRERAAASAEVARLEAALREAKAKVGGKAKRPSSPNRAAAGRATAEKYGGEKVPCAKGCGRLVSPLPGPRGAHEKKCGGAA